jgi:hypothetical protein
MRQPARMQTSAALLHQRGPQRSDKFGADFALTIDVTGLIKFRKTALFQTKLATNYSATVESNQLQQALAVPEFVGRCFTMAADRTRLVIRIESVDKLASSFSAGQASKTFDATLWHPSTMWMVDWLKCQHGTQSNAIDGPQIQSLLSAHILQRFDPFHNLMVPGMKNATYLMSPVSGTIRRSPSVKMPNPPMD